jgi:uncharacterized protein (TIGR02444 family)
VRLWDYAVALYARPAVEAACLRLQDEEGQCAPLLLWRLWSVHEGRGVDGPLEARAAATARAWEGQIVAPLREIRLRLEAPLPPIAEAGRAALRQTVAAAELAAEQILLDALEALTPGPGGSAADVATALRAIAAAWGKPLGERGLRRLVQAVRPERSLADAGRSATS